MNARQLVAVFAVLLPAFMYGFYRFSVGVLVPTLEKVYSVGDPTAGAIVSGSVGLVGIGVIASGFLSQRYGDLKVILGGLVLFSVAMAAVTISAGIAAFSALFLVASLGSGLVITPSYSIAAALFPKRKGFAASYVSAGYNFAGFIGPAATSYLLAGYGWNAPFLMFTGVGLLIFLVVIAVLGRGAPPSSGSGLRSFASLLKIRVVRVLSLAVFFADLGFLVYLSWAPKFLALNFGATASDATTLDSVFGIGLGLGGLGTLAGGNLYDRIGGRKSIVVAGLLPAGALVGTYLAPSFLVVVVFVLLTGILGNIFWPLITAMCQENVSQQDRTAATSVVQTAGFVGAFIGPGLAGAAGGPIAPVLLLTSAAPYLVLTFIGGVFYVDPKRQAAPRTITGETG